jgi:virginiamycin B lyase
MKLSNIFLTISLTLLSSYSALSIAGTVQVKDQSGHLVNNVMVSQTPVSGYTVDRSDSGYPPEGVVNRSSASYTKFTNMDGRVQFSSFNDQLVRYRLRKPGYKDQTIEIGGSDIWKAIIKLELDPVLLAASRPANTWLAALDLETDLKKHYIMQCGFCHQQGSMYLRRDRSVEQWDEIIYRMVNYGARLADDAQSDLPKLLHEKYGKLNANPELISAGTPWAAHLIQSSIVEWPIGDSFSQMHDLLYHSTGKVYVGDNLQDRMYEIDVETGEYSVFKLPREDWDQHGGLLGSRLKHFPKHETFAGIHSFAESKKDGSIFITASYQQRIIEFNPITKKWTNHHMDGGYYPHTLRIDKDDNVWFTLALSNQVGVFNRKTKAFKLIDLPSRGIKETITIKLMGVLFKLMSWGLPVGNWASIDRDSTGVPLPYGIDIAPDGGIWFARLHADSIGRIDPETHEIKMYDTPFKGPRRLRIDKEGGIWIAAFPESQIVRFDQQKETFKFYDLPVEPFGSETPYSLNIDHSRSIIWVNGNTSDALYAYYFKEDRWQHYPMPKKVTFTRDVEIAPDGTVFTTNSSFPSWHIEDAQPTLIVLKPSISQ